MYYIDNFLNEIRKFTFPDSWPAVQIYITVRISVAEFHSQRRRGRNWNEKNIQDEGKMSEKKGKC